MFSEKLEILFKCYYGRNERTDVLLPQNFINKHCVASLILGDYVSYFALQWPSVLFEGSSS